MKEPRHTSPEDNQAPLQESPWWRSTLAGILLMCVVIYLVVQWVDIDVSISYLLKTDWKFALLTLIAAFIDRYLMAYKWATLVRAKQIKISNFDAFQIYLMSGFVGMFLGTSVGGDIVRTARTHRTTGNLEKITATILMERMLGMLAVASVALVGLIFLIGEGNRRIVPILVLVSCVLFGMIVTLTIATNGRICNWINVRMSRFRRYRVANLALEAHQSFVILSDHIPAIIWFYILSVVEHLILAIMNLLAAQALGLDVPLAYFVAIIPITTIVGMLPLPIGGLGVFEGIYVLLFALVGLDGTQSLSLALLLRIIGIGVLLPGAIIFVKDVLNWKTMKQSQ